MFCSRADARAYHVGEELLDAAGGISPEQDWMAVALPVGICARTSSSTTIGRRRCWRRHCLVGAASSFSVADHDRRVEVDHQAGQNLPAGSRRRLRRTGDLRALCPGELTSRRPSKRHADASAGAESV